MIWGHEDPDTNQPCLAHERDSLFDAAQFFFVVELPSADGESVVQIACLFLSVQSQSARMTFIGFPQDNAWIANTAATTFILFEKLTI